MKELHGNRRRGSLYVAVLGSTMVITVIGISALMLARVERSSVVGTADLSAARFYAQSAIEMGQHKIRQDSNWRTTYTSGAWETDRTIGSGKYTLEGIDPVDGNLNNSAADSLLLRGTGFEGQSRYKLQVTMTAKSNALTCLQVAMHAGNDLTFNSATVESNSVTISANNNAVASSSVVNPKVEVVNSYSGSSYPSGVTTGITARTMPAATVFDSYNGTAIPITSILSSKGVKTIDKKIFSPNSNPYGMVKDASGIYVIDCLGANLLIRNSRIVGTLVILNPGTLTIDQAMNWEPAIANYPSLLVSGGVVLAISNSDLSETSSNVNYNPSHTPYAGGYDTDTTDTYPSIMKGLIYASGDVTTKNYVTIDGVLVIGNTLTTQNTLSLTYQSTFYDNPPPGFGGAPEMVISPGTWKQLVD
ncbi:MAG: hypothetical protein AAB363_04285 [Planctomycetota bacterium]